MRTVRASAQIAGADLDQVWAVVSHSERYPLLVEHILEVNRRDDGAAQWCALLNGSRVSWVQRERGQPPRSLVFEQVRGDLDRLRGRWTLRPRPAGVWLGLDVEFSLGLDGLAPLFDPIWEQSFQAHADAVVGALARAVRSRPDETRTA